MTVLKFAAYCGALVVFPAVLAGSLTFWLLEEIARRIEGRTMPGVVDEFESWYVGEHGPEVLVSRTNGTVAPRSVP